MVERIQKAYSELQCVEVLGNTYIKHPEWKMAEAKEGLLSREVDKKTEYYTNVTKKDGEVVATVVDACFYTAHEGPTGLLAEVKSSGFDVKSAAIGAGLGAAIVGIISFLRK